MGIVRRSSTHLLIGLIVLLIGIIFFVENVFGIEIWMDILPFWPIAFILWSVIEIFQKKSIFFGLILLVIGITFLLSNFKMIFLPNSIWKYWPISIIAIGLDQLISRYEPYYDSKHRPEKREKKHITYDDEII